MWQGELATRKAKLEYMLSSNHYASKQGDVKPFFDWEIDAQRESINRARETIKKLIDFFKNK